MQEENRKVIFVGGLNRTSGSMLPFFLDGTPGLVGLPFELHPSNVQGKIITKKLFETSSVEEILKEIVKPQLFFDTFPKTSDKSKQVYPFDSKKFIASLRGLILSKEVDEKNYLYVMARLWAEQRGVDFGNGLFVDHSGHGFEYDTTRLFEENKIGFYVYTKRNFLNWYASFIKVCCSHKADDFYLAEQAYQVKCIADNLAEYYERIYPEKFKVVEYENILNNPSEVYDSLIAFFGLERPEEISLSATYLGEPVLPNTSFKEKASDPTKLKKITVEQLGLFSSKMIEFLRELSGQDVYPAADEINRNTARLLHEHICFFQLAVWGFNSKIESFTTKEVASNFMGRIRDKIISTCKIG